MERDITRAYWGHYNESDWKQGSRWRHVRTTPDGTVDIVGTVLEIDPPSRLVVSWVLPREEGDDAKTSRVTYALTPNGDETLLTVTTATSKRVPRWTPASVRAGLPSCRT